MHSHSANEAKIEREIIKKAANEKASADLQKAFLTFATSNGKTLTPEELEKKHLDWLNECSKFKMIPQLRDHYWSIKDEEKTTDICHAVINAFFRSSEIKQAIEVFKKMPHHLMTLETHAKARSFGKRLNKNLVSKKYITEEDKVNISMLLVIYNRTHCMQQEISRLAVSLMNKDRKLCIEVYHRAIDELIASRDPEEALGMLESMPPVLRNEKTHEKLESILELFETKPSDLTESDYTKFYSILFGAHSNHLFKPAPATQPQPKTSPVPPRPSHHSWRRK